MVIRNEHEPINIFFLFTPLHVLIADAIVREEKLSRVYFVGFIEASGKVATYCDRYCPDNGVVKILRLHRRTKSIATFVEIWNLAKELTGNRIVFFSGTIKSIYSRIFLFLAGENTELNTFDDGYGSIAGTGYFYLPDRPIKKLVLLMLLGGRYEYMRLVRSINRAYTIFDSKNVYGDVCSQLVRLHFKPKASVLDEQCGGFAMQKRLKVLMTQPYSERRLIAETKEINAYNHIIDEFSINLRLAHPSEKRGKDAKLKVFTVDTDVVAEEYICALAKKSYVEVYGFGSTSLIILASLADKNIFCHWLCHRELNPQPPVGGASAFLNITEIFTK